MSVGDVVRVGNDLYITADEGWKRLPYKRLKKVI
jgi:hypothetical protein